MTKRPSLRASIDAKCKECIYDSLTAGKWREQVAVCTSANCSLFPVRPVPIQCVANGFIDMAKVAVVRERLAQMSGLGGKRPFGRSVHR